MVSYAIQGFTSLAFGPVLGGWLLYAGSDSNSDSYLVLPAGLWVSEFLVPVAKSIQQTNIVISFSVLLAALIRLSQASPLAERSFLQHLAIYEFRIAVICAFSFRLMHESSILTKRLLVFYVSGVSIMAWVAVNLARSGVEHDHVSVFEAITKYCVQQHDWPVPEIRLAPPTTYEPPPTVEPPIFGESTVIGQILDGVLFFLRIVARSLFLVLVGITFVAAIFVFPRVIKRIFGRPYRATCRMLRVGPRRLGAILTTAGLTAIGISLVWTRLWALQARRQQLRAASGSAYQDDECKCHPQVSAARIALSGADLVAFRGLWTDRCCPCVDARCAGHTLRRHQFVSLALKHSEQH